MFGANKSETPHCPIMNCIPLLIIKLFLEVCQLQGKTEGTVLH